LTVTELPYNLRFPRMYGIELVAMQTCEVGVTQVSFNMWY